MTKVMKMLNRRRVELFTITLTANKLYAQYSCYVCRLLRMRKRYSRDQCIKHLLQRCLWAHWLSGVRCAREKTKWLEGGDVSLFSSVSTSLYQVYLQYVAVVKGGNSRVYIYTACAACMSTPGYVHWWACSACALPPIRRSVAAQLHEAAECS